MIPRVLILLSCYVFQSTYFLWRVPCLTLLMWIGTRAALAEPTPVEVIPAAAASPASETASVSSPVPTSEDQLEVITDPAVSQQVPELAGSKPFLLPAKQHPWASFEPGAWRELQIVSEAYDEAGQVVNRSVTQQKEVLEAVDDEKYVLKVQATVDLSGKRIVGDWKTRVSHLSVDGAGPLVDSRRLADQAWSLAGRTTDCQVWELRYRDGARKLKDRLFYHPQQFPFVWRRETFSEEQTQDAEAERVMEMVATTLPYQLGEQLLECSCLRTLRHRAKGDTVRLAFLSSAVPGGEVSAWFTDTDAAGRRVRSSAAQLLTFSTRPEVALEASSSAAAEPATAP